MRRTGTFGCSTSSTCQPIASPSRSSSVARMSSSAPLSAAFSSATTFFFDGVHDVDRVEVVVGVDAGEPAVRLLLVVGHLVLAAGQVADVPDARLHRVVVAEEARDGARLRR